MEEKATVYEVVLSYPRLKSYLQSQQQCREQEKTLGAVEKIVDEIHGQFHHKVASYAISFLEHSFAKLYDSINLTMPTDFQLAELQKDHHIVLVPNHQSHADYLALNYLLYRRFQIPVYIAAGINLNIFPIGGFFRKMGAFFIRRSFASDYLYRTTFEGYIYYLLKQQKVVEFFFEGGRSRTGKLLPPKFGLFQMLLETHSIMDDKKPLMFIPVSIAHEHVPEEKAHERELSGAKKKKENPTQLLKLVKLFSKRLGSIHVNIGEGIVVEQVHSDIKSKTQELAFQCFRSVGAGMPVTPTSLLALVLLDESSGAMTWEQILFKCQEVINFAKRFQIPLTPSLSGSSQGDKLKQEKTLWRALNILIRNKKVEVLERSKLNHTYYTVRKDARIKLCYFKNMILHHFLVPSLINNTWFNVFNGNLSTVKQLVQYLITKRRELKFEFYLPPVKEMFAESMEIISYAVGRPIKNFEDCFKLSSAEFFQIAQRVQSFSTALTSIYESYYCSLLAIRHFHQEGKIFTADQFLQVAKEIHSIEIEHGRVVRYPESAAVPTLKESLKYFCHMELLEILPHGANLSTAVVIGSNPSKTRSDDKTREYRVLHPEKLNDKIEKFAKDINDQLVTNLKFSYQK